MGWLVRVFLRIVLFPLWVILGLLQVVGNIIIGFGNIVFYVLSGLCFLTAVICIGLLGETLADQRVILIGGCTFGIFSFILINVLSFVALMKIFIGDLIFG